MALHAFVATPAYDGKVECGFAQSLAEASFCAPLYGMKLTAAVMGNGAFIDLARNIFVKMFLEKDEFKECTHLFFIDSDLKFEARAFVGLLKANLPICAGVYRRRQEPEDYPIKWQPHPEKGGLWLSEEGFLWASRVPTGFLCIRRDVLTEMSKDAIQMDIHGQDGPVPRLFYTRIDENRRFVGEDFTFCDDYVAKYNEYIPVWPDFNFVHGGYDCNFHAWLTAQALEHGQDDATLATSSAA